jgi:hypothetical protein
MLLVEKMLRVGIEYQSVSDEKLMKAESKSNKMKSAITFIEYFAKEF